MTLDPADQARRRRRNRIAQRVIAKALNTSVTSISDYETGQKPLPFQMTPDDYERALEAAIREAREASDFGGAK